VAQTLPTPNPMTWATPPYAASPYSIAMVAATATSTDGGGVEYYFEDRWHPQFSSGWQSSRTYSVRVGRAGQLHRFKVKARDLYGNEKRWSSEEIALP